MTRRVATWLTVLTFLVGTPAFATPDTLRGPQAGQDKAAAEIKSGLEEKAQQGHPRYESVENAALGGALRVDTILSQGIEFHTSLWGGIFTGKGRGRFMYFWIHPRHSSWKTALRRHEQVIALLKGFGDAKHPERVYEELAKLFPGSNAVSQRLATGLEEDGAEAAAAPRLIPMSDQVLTDVQVRALPRGAYLALGPEAQRTLYQVRWLSLPPLLAQQRLGLQPVNEFGQPGSAPEAAMPIADIMRGSPQQMIIPPTWTAHPPEALTGLEERPIQWMSAGQFADDRRFLALAADHLRELQDQLGLTISGSGSPLDAIRAQVRLTFTDVGLITHHNQRWTTLPVYLAANEQNFDIVAKILEETLTPLLAGHKLTVVVQPLPLLAEVPPPGLLFVYGKFLALPGLLAERVGELRELWERDAKQEIALIELPKDLEEAEMAIRRYTADDLVVKAFAPTLQQRLGAVTPLVLTFQDRKTGDAYTTIWL